MGRALKGTERREVVSVRLEPSAIKKLSEEFGSVKDAINYFVDLIMETDEKCS